MTDTSGTEPTRHVVAVGGPRAGQHGTAPTAHMRRSALLTLLTTNPPQPVPAGCEVTWEDNITTSYPVVWLRSDPLIPSG